MFHVEITTWTKKRHHFSLGKNPNLKTLINSNDSHLSALHEHPLFSYRYLF